MEQIVLVGGVIGTLMHTGYVVGSLSMQVRTFSSLLFVLMLETGLGCCFGMISGAGTAF